MDQRTANGILEQVRESSDVVEGKEEGKYRRELEDLANSILQTQGNILQPTFPFQGANEIC